MDASWIHRSESQPHFNRLLLWTAAALTVFVWHLRSNVAHASEAESAAPDERIVEQIVVTGFRSSLERSREIKRDSVSLIESIVAEDIADFPDLNLAESLQRVPGVSISRDSGEGRQISMRGLGANFVRTRLNGLEALFTTDSGIDQRGSAARTRDFDFSVFASELFRRVDVHKSYDASLSEGGLAGTVDLYTARPFDYPGLEAAATVKGLHNDLTKNDNLRVAGLLSNNWGNFGALASVAYSEVDSVERGYHVWSWRQASFGEANVAPSVDPAVRDRLVNATGRDRVFVPRANNIASWNNTRERLGLTGALQWQPSYRLRFGLDVLYGELSNDRMENQISTAGTNAFTGDVRNGALLTDAAIIGDDLLYAQFENLDLRTESKVSYGETEFHQISFTSEFDFTPDLSGRLLLGTSESEFDQPIHDKVFAEASGHRFSVDWRDADFGQNSYDFDIADFAEWSLMRTDVREDMMSNDYSAANLDFTWDVNDSSAFEFGVHLKRYDSDGLQRRDREDWEDQPGAPEAVFQLTEIPVLRPYAIANNEETFARVVQAERIDKDGNGTGRLLSRMLDPSHNRPGTVYQIEEDTVAAYVNYNWTQEWFGKLVRGNLGVRWFETDQVSSGEVQTGTGFEYATFERKYDDFLPALNISLEMTDEWLWRFSANQNISRPGLNDLRAAGQVEVADTRINAGNPNLEPFKADSIDTSVEYYGESAYFAAGVFYKNMGSFIVTRSATLPYVQTGYPLEFLDFDIRVDQNTEFTVSQPINGDSAEAMGLELAFQMDFDRLPPPFNYLGVAGNYTYADGETTLFNEGEAFTVAPPGLSEHSYNFTVYYEAERWGLRMATSYRDDYIQAEGASQNVVEGYDDTLFVDFKAFYNVNDRFEITLEGLNLTNERIRYFLDHRTQSYTKSGVSWLLGVSARL